MARVPPARSVMAVNLASVVGLAARATAVREALPVRDDTVVHVDWVPLTVATLGAVI
jgi:hypothetical protein